MKKDFLKKVLTQRKIEDRTPLTMSNKKMLCGYGALLCMGSLLNATVPLPDFDKSIVLDSSYPEHQKQHRHPEKLGKVMDPIPLLDFDKSIVLDSSYPKRRKRHRHPEKLEKIHKILVMDPVPVLDFNDPIPLPDFGDPNDSGDDLFRFYLPLPELSIRLPQDKRSSEDKINEQQRAKEQWISFLQKLAPIGISLEVIDRRFSFLGYYLASLSQMATNQFEQDLLANRLKEQPVAYCSCTSLKIGSFKGKPYILKVKPQAAHGIQNPWDETLAGEKIRLAVLEEIQQIHGDDPTRSLDDIFHELEYLDLIVAPVDCGTYIASREIPQSKPLIDIILSRKRQLLTNLPFPYAAMNFAVDATIRRAQNIRRALSFLHKNHIYHNDLCPRNLLISGDDYSQAYLIDFGAATFDSRFQIDSTLTGWLLFQYLLRTPLAKECPVHDECHQLLLGQFEMLMREQTREQIIPEQMEQMQPLIFADF
ncbi:MAG: hypothetical protein LBB05_01555 [Puniceicoccales bacterium]|jgi:hypothetical protein|nr:hypothetical protein [Puniceicoccales bacterium]